MDQGRITVGDGERDLAKGSPSRKNITKAATGQRKTWRMRMYEDDCFKDPSDFQARLSPRSFGEKFHHFRVRRSDMPSSS